MRAFEIGPEDTQALTALDALCFPSHTAFSRREFRRLVASPHVVGRRVEIVGALVGFVLAAAYGERGEIVTIDVHPAFRRRGLGRGLLRWAHAAMQSRGVRVAGLHVRSDNLGAVGLYESEGYTVVRRVPGYYADSSDALEMVRTLGDGPAEDGAGGCG